MNVDHPRFFSFFLSCAFIIWKWVLSVLMELTAVWWIRIQRIRNFSATRIRIRKKMDPDPQRAKHRPKSSENDKRSPFFWLKQCDVAVFYSYIIWPSILKGIKFTKKLLNFSILGQIQAGILKTGSGAKLSGSATLTYRAPAWPYLSFNRMVFNSKAFTNTFSFVFLCYCLPISCFFRYLSLFIHISHTIS